MFYLKSIVFIFSLAVLSSCSKITETKETKTDSLDLKVEGADSDIEELATVNLVVKDWTNSDIRLSLLIDSLDIKTDNLRIKISKSEYELGIYSDTLLLKSYPVVFGGNPIDDKLRRGDKCTPEGIFKVKSKYIHAKWSRFIWIDYPNEDSWKKHNLAKEKGIISKKADIGGEIGIHGIPSDYDAAIDYRQNWTLGCISMKNKDVMEIYPFVRNEMTIEIVK